MCVQYIYLENSDFTEFFIESLLQILATLVEEVKKWCKEKTSLIGMLVVQSDGPNCCILETKLMISRSLFAHNVISIQFLL